MKAFVEALENGTGYGYLAENYWNMSKDSLANIAKELLYALEEHGDLEDVADELRDTYYEEWEDERQQREWDSLEGSEVEDMMYLRRTER